MFPLSRVAQLEQELAINSSEAAETMSKNVAERSRVAEERHIEGAQHRAESKALAERAELAESACAAARQDAESTAAALAQALVSLQTATDKLSR